MKLIYAAVFSILLAPVAIASSIADNPNAVRPPLLGSAAPAALVHSLDGKAVQLGDIISGKPTILVFYRGGWCPYCNIQLSGLGKIDAELKALGYQMIALSPDKPEELAKSVEKNALPYALYSDSKLNAIKALGIGFTVDATTIEKYIGYGIDLEKSSGETHHVLPVPSVFVIDAKGIIQFHYVNPDYKIRVPESVILAAAKAALNIKPLK